MKSVSKTSKKPGAAAASSKANVVQGNQDSGNMGGTKAVSFIL